MPTARCTWGTCWAYIQTDIWVRYQQLAGNDCIFVCADDAHGTPIMLKARELGITPEELIAGVNGGARTGFQGFPRRLRQLPQHPSRRKPGAGDAHLQEPAGCQALPYRCRTIRQFYDEQAKMFLPDRFIKGDLSALRHAGPVRRFLRELRRHLLARGSQEPGVGDLRHSAGGTRVRALLLQARRLRQMLHEWTRCQATCTRRCTRKLDEWFTAGLQDWDISRDAPYFGFEIPDAPGKYFYVWLDAPIGYMASFKNLCCPTDPWNSFDDFWKPTARPRIRPIHFIGKDIIYFHSLFWPAMLQARASARLRRCTSTAS